MYTYKPQGVCSRLMTVELNDDNIISEVTVTGGCAGNLLGLTSMCEGQKASDIIEKLKGIKCGAKQTSCPDQLTMALELAISEKSGNR